METDPNNTLTFRCAVIGVGKPTHTWAKGGGHQIGYAHARTYLANPRCSLVSGADINPENLAAFQKKWDVEQGFEDYREMLATAKPDIVSICTYVGLHRDMVLACADAGVKGILLEKPALHSPKAIIEIDEALSRTGMKLCVAHVRRHLPNFRRIRELIEAGRIGRPLLFAAGIDGWDLSEWGGHWLDAFRYFNGDRPVEWVMGQGRVRDARGYGHAMEDHGLCVFEFDNKARGLLDGGKALGAETEDRPTLTILGETGALYLRDWVERLELVSRNGNETFIESAGENGETDDNTWAPWLQSMVDWLDGGTPPLTAWEQCRGSMELNLAAYVSMLRSDRMDLPFDAEAIKLDEWPVELLRKP